MKLEEFKIIHNEIAKAIKETKYNNCLFYVGGCVRNLYFKKDFSHINICVSLKDTALEFAIFLAKKLGIYSEEEGFSNPIIFKSLNKAELLLPSIEDKTPPCYITISEISNTLKEDACSRDFTVNAVYCKVSNRMTYDFIGTCHDDLNQKVIKCCSDSTKTFSDSPIRILRAIRIASELELSIHHDTWVGICKNVSKLHTIDKQSIRNELNKIFVSQNPSLAFNRLYHCGALEVIMPELCRLKNIRQGVSHYEDAFDHSLTVMSKTMPILEHRIAGLLHDLGKQTAFESNLFGDIKFKNHEELGIDLAELLLEDLRYDEVTINKVSIAIKNHTRFKSTYNPSNHSIKKFINDVELENVDICLDVIEANNMSHSPKYCIDGQTEKIRKRIKCLSTSQDSVQLPINGNDIILKFKLKKGPLIGKCLALVEERMRISPKMTKDEALDLIEKEILVF